MMFSKNVLSLALILTSGLTLKAVKPTDMKVVEEAEKAYRVIYDHYSDLLETYYLIDKNKTGDRFYHCAGLVEKVRELVKAEKLPLYGNFFNKLWKNMSGASSERLPLTKFVTVLSEDAIGHLSKYRGRIIEVGGSILKIDDLLASIRGMQEIVKRSSEYISEGLYAKIDLLEAEVTRLKSDLQRERERYAALEREAYTNRRVY